MLASVADLSKEMSLARTRQGPSCVGCRTAGVFAVEKRRSGKVEEQTARSEKQMVTTLIVVVYHSSRRHGSESL
jgi:hypothetical protein